MKISIKQKLDFGSDEAVVLPIFKDQAMSPVFGAYPELESVFHRVRFNGKAGGSIVFHSAVHQRLLVVVGAGKGDAGRLVDIIKCAKEVVNTLEHQKIKNAVLHFVQDVPLSGEFWKSFIDFLYISAYSFDRYLSRKEVIRLKELGIYSVSPLTVEHLTEVLIKRQDCINRSVVMVRDLVNEPPAKVNPDYLVAAFQMLAAQHKGLTVSVLRKRELLEQNLPGILAVGNASPYEPALVRVSYRPAQVLKTVALVGKGITFDAGGLNIKTGNSMSEMKCDMSGAAAVLGVMSALPALELPIAVEAYVPIAENVVGANGYKPGDILTFRNKKTVEVVNTDSEGRLLLADALISAVHDHPDYIVELSTLTGGVVNALGDDVAGLMGNHKQLIMLLLRAGRNTGERLWQLPLVDDYKESIKSKIADLKNCGYGPAHTIKAALFLKEFVSAVPFAHLDIAGTAFLSKASGFYLREGATGFGVRLVIEYLGRLS